MSTPASIIEVFHIAKSFQDRRDNATFASVVVLDEVGLAEASPHLPLKALHPLLEDGTEGSGSSDEVFSNLLRYNIDTFFLHSLPKLMFIYRNTIVAYGIIIYPLLL